MSYITFYNNRGKAIAWLSEDDYPTIYLYNGKPVGWISNESVYAFSGKHLGWYVDGWIIDHKGYYVYFTEISNGGPVKPCRQVRPVRGVRQVRPVRGVMEVSPVRPYKSLSWSDLNDKFFEQ